MIKNHFSVFFLYYARTHLYLHEWIACILLYIGANIVNRGTIACTRIKLIIHTDYNALVLFVNHSFDEKNKCNSDKLLSRNTSTKLNTCLLCITYRVLKKIIIMYTPNIISDVYLWNYKNIFRYTNIDVALTLSSAGNTLSEKMNP